MQPIREERSAATSVEISHLDVALILDPAKREQRKGALRALREGTTYGPRIVRAWRAQEGSWFRDG
jgi:hypothetical protein